MTPLLTSFDAWFGQDAPEEDDEEFLHCGNTDEFCPGCIDCKAELLVDERQAELHDLHETALAQLPEHLQEGWR
jgi:hypothetical protein